MFSIVFTKVPLKLSCYLLTVNAAGQSLHSRMTASHHCCEWQQADKGKSYQDSFKTSLGLAGLSGRASCWAEEGPRVSQAGIAATGGTPRHWELELRLGC